MAISELQLGLFAAGGAAIAVVWGYNIWQERKHRKAVERLFKGEQADVLLDEAETSPSSDDAAGNPSEPLEDARHEPGERLEPTLGLPEPEPEPAFVAAVAPEPTAVAEMPAAPSDIPTASDEPAASAVSVEAPLIVIDTDVSPADPFSDCVVRFSLPAAVSAASVMAEQVGWSAMISKPLMWLGRNPGDAVWSAIGAASAGHYRDWVAALQLADRRGAVSERELAKFLEGIGHSVRILGAEIELPDIGEVLQRAVELDAFCASVDVQFGIHVVEASGGSFAGTKLRGVCEAAGLILGGDGCFHSVNESGAEEFRIANIGEGRFAAESLRSLTTQGVSLTIDVPRVAEGAAAFTRMITTAQQLARGLGGVLVDVHRAPLADAMISGIRAKIVELQQQMKAADIPPGSARALKLFA